MTFRMFSQKNHQGYGSCWKSETCADIYIVGPVKVVQSIGMHDYIPSATTQNMSVPDI